MRLDPLLRAFALPAGCKRLILLARHSYPEGCYSQAIVLDPTSAIYPLNRAQAYLKLDKFASPAPYSSLLFRLRLTQSHPSYVFLVPDLRMQKGTARAQ